MEEITNRLVLRLLNEAVSCVREQVVADRDLLDAGMIFGTGFAPFRGGPMHHLDALGATALLQQLKTLRALRGDRFKPDQGWGALNDSSGGENGMSKAKTDIIPAAVSGTLAGLFRERVRRSPDKIAYRQYHTYSRQWRDTTWKEMATEVARWQDALAQEGLQHGDRVAILLRNCKEWVTFDQAALGCGLVVVPLYTDDRPESAAYILNHSGAKVLLLQGEDQWQGLLTVHDQLDGLVRIITLEPVTVPDGETRVRTLADWLPETGGELHTDDGESSELATIVYTSGTTGRPKGVMLSHWNILFDSESALEIVHMYCRMTC